MKNAFMIIGAGFIVGLFSGLLGIGGGVLLVPIMVSVLGLQQHVATATSLAVVVPMALISSFLYQTQGNLDIAWAIKIVAGSVLGAYLGATLACRLPAETLRKMFGGVLFVIGIRMVIG